MKRDGHTHTEYCPHGNVEDTELLIKQAIHLGFKEYSITEHAPLPKDITISAAGNPEVWSTAAMSLNDVDHYFNRMNTLRKKYASDILIHLGFEIDYFHDFEDWTKDFLSEYGSQTDDGVLSVHFLSGENGLYGIDYSFEEYKHGIVDFLGSQQKAQQLYYETVLQSLEADLGKYKPTRLGHISLCQKFERFFSSSSEYDNKTLKLVSALLNKVQQKGYTLDLNTAGFFKEGYQQSYPQSWMIQQAQSLGISFIYGSDAHSLEDIGRGYDKVNSFL